MTAVSKCTALLALASASPLALAHAGHGADATHSALVEAFLHPFSGLDHLLMMVAIGVCAGRAGGALRWQLPVAFLSGMLGGWALGAAGVVVPGLESGIAATLIALGVAMTLPWQPARVAQVGGVAAFAVLHGLAHGSELRGASAWPAAVGMLGATALLHLAGIAGAGWLTRGVAFRAAGVGVALAGGALLASI